MFGFGNWAAVAEHVGTKGQQDCRSHYYSVYIDSPAFPEPAPLPSMANVNQLQVWRSYFATSALMAPVISALIAPVMSWQ